MDANADKHLSCQLETRHWVITDDEGTEERVDGPGVVGMLSCECVYVCALFLYTVTQFYSSFYCSIMCIL